MSFSPQTKYAVHIVTLLLWVTTFQYFSGSIAYNSSNGPEAIDPVTKYGYTITTLLYIVKFMSLLVLPQVLFNIAGMVSYNSFTDVVKLNAAPLLAPFVCFRVVTKGMYPDLVKENIVKNLKTCYDAGLENFMFEVVTDNAIHLQTLTRCREVVVPTSYRTKSGAKYKARALQYCLEEDVNMLQDENYIVHLDEETLLTENCVRGIVNFMVDGKYDFGQGVITYANGEIVNWITTLCDCFRVADDMGKLRFQLSYLHSPIFGWKGSYVVTKYVASERKVTYDHGVEGSIAEDCFFSMVAIRDNFTFDFIEGDMMEKSPFNFWDLLQQRKRWLQGIYLTVHSSQIPWKTKMWLGLSLYAWITMPITSFNLLLCPLLPVPTFFLFDFLVTLIGSVNLYMYVYGASKSFSSRYRGSNYKIFIYIISAIAVLPFNIIIENMASLMGTFASKDEFYVVKKDVIKLPIDMV
uniref:Glyco_trans_2-like domain-containing protein n=1 Tax=Rhabditophanes sp. KR3021 TaxID=114890 RepID=A0AC35UD44_9BILA